MVILSMIVLPLERARVGGEYTRSLHGCASIAQIHTHAYASVALCYHTEFPWRRV